MSGKKSLTLGKKSLTFWKKSLTFGKIPWLLGKKSLTFGKKSLTFRKKSLTYVKKALTFGKKLPIFSYNTLNGKESLNLGKKSLLLGKNSPTVFINENINFPASSICRVTNPVRPIYMSVIQVTQPVGYVGTLPAIRINESTAEWTARDCYVSLLAASPPFSSIKLLRNCPIFLNITNIIII